MREHLLREFSVLHELHLHGGVNEIAEESHEDQNVFEIAQAVGIHAYVRRTGDVRGLVRFSELWGPRAKKYSFLASHSVSNTKWKPVAPDSEGRAFVPQESACGLAMVRLTEVFMQFGAGIKTNRDAIAIAFSKTELSETARFFSPQLLLRATAEKCVQPILYRPFDERVVFYHEQVVASRSVPTMQHVLAGANIGLIASSTWTSPDRFSVNVSRTMVEMKTGTHDRGTTYFPLYRYESILGGCARKVHNLNPEFIAQWNRLTEAPLTLELHGDHTQPTDPEDLFHWVYGICHSKAYRRRYRAVLAQGFPTVLFPREPALFKKVARLGSELVALHLMESPKLDRFITIYTGQKNPEVRRIGYSDDTVWLDAAATKKGQPAKPGSIGFRGVSEAVWNFHIGGYRVCEKWLKYREGRTLSEDDIAHYQKIVVALAETIRLMKEIDAVIEQHGGWPGAFQSAAEKSAQDAAPGKVIPFRPRVVEPRPGERYVTCVPLVPLKAAAGAFTDPQHIEDDGWEWIAVDSKRRLHSGMFVARVVGKSMEPLIADGAYCLFAAPVTGTRQSKTVLVQLRDATDAETGERYTVKRYESEKTRDADSWRHAMITLKPVNPAFQPIVLSGAEQGQLQVVAELIEVLSSKA